MYYRSTEDSLFYLAQTLGLRVRDPQLCKRCIEYHQQDVDIDLGQMSLLCTTAILDQITLCGAGKTGDCPVPIGCFPASLASTH